MRAEIDKNPNESIRNLARTFNVNAMTMKRLVNDDMGLKSLRGGAGPAIDTITEAEEVGNVQSHDQQSEGKVGWQDLGIQQ